jgi:hypothetical protein
VQIVTEWNIKKNIHKLTTKKEKNMLKIKILDPSGGLNYLARLRISDPRNEHYISLIRICENAYALCINIYIVDEIRGYDIMITSDNLEYLIRRMYHYARNLQ